MAIQFPNNPGIGSVFIDSDSGFSYEWTGVVWKSFSPASTSNIKELDDISSSFDNSTTTFNLTIDSAAYKPVSAAMLQISLGGVIQEPTTDYTVSFADATITFTTAPNAGLDFFGVVRGTSVSLVTTDGVLDTLSVTGVSTVGVVTGATSIQSGVYYGDGSQLTGISVDSTSLKDDGGNVKAQANPGGVVITGVLTSTSFSGDGSGLTGVASTDNIQTATEAEFLSGVKIAGVTTTSGLIDINAGGRANTFKVEDLTSGRVVLAGAGGEIEDSANLTFNGSDLVVSGNVSIGGTLTYQDVTNIDSVGIITAQQGIQVLANGVDVTGIGTFEDRLTYDGSLGQAGGGTVTYTVTVASKDSTHRYNGSGSGNGYVIDNLQAPVLTLTPGRTYRFDQSDSSNSGHRLRFYYQANKTTQYTTNVTVSGTLGSDAYTEITITDETPAVLHYQCESHDLMGNSVITQSNPIVGAGITLNADHGGIDVVGVVTCTELHRATLVNYAEKVNTLGNTGSAATIDIADGTYVTATLNAGATITLTDPPSGKLYGVVIELLNDGGSHSLAWASSGGGNFKWPGGSQPTRTDTDAKTDIWSFFTSDGGANWIGSITLFNIS